MTVEGPDENVSICCNSSVVIETLLNIKQSQRWMGLLSNYPILKNRTKKEGTHTTWPDRRASRSKIKLIKPVPGGLASSNVRDTL